MNYYNDFANDYYDLTGNLDPGPLCSNFIAGVKSHIKKETKEIKILDIGCGSGRDSYYLASYGFKVISLDKSINLLKLAQTNNSYKKYNINFIAADFSLIPFKTESFDAIFAQASLLHIPKKDLNSVLLEIRRILTPGGIFYFSLKAGTGESYDDKGRFFSYYNNAEIIKILSKLNFSIISQENSNSIDKRDIIWLSYLVAKT